MAHNGKKVKRKPILVEDASTPFKLKSADAPPQVIFNEQREILAHEPFDRARNLMLTVLPSRDGFGRHIEQLGKALRRATEELPAD